AVPARGRKALAHDPGDEPLGVALVHRSRGQLLERSEHQAADGERRPRRWHAAGDLPASLPALHGGLERGRDALPRLRVHVALLTPVADEAVAVAQLDN